MWVCACANGRPRPVSGAAQPVFPQTRLRENTARRQKGVGSPLHLCTGSAPSSSTPLSGNPDSLPSPLFSVSSFTLPRLFLQSVLFLPLSWVTWVDVTSPGDRRPQVCQPVTGTVCARACVCVCVRALREGAYSVKSWLCARARLPGRTRLIHQSP